MGACAMLPLRFISSSNLSAWSATGKLDNLVRKIQKTRKGVKSNLGPFFLILRSLGIYVKHNPHNPGHLETFFHTMHRYRTLHPSIP